MPATPEYYTDLMDAFEDDESLTVLVVAGAGRAEVADALGLDLSETVEEQVDIDDQASPWAVVDVPGGVLAIETTGYGDPSLEALRVLASGGRAAAVVRNNIQAHLRFGCARDGALLFDDDEYMYTEDPSAVPDELRPLFDLVWDDLESDSDEPDDGPDGFAVGMAMAELVTGVAIDADHVAAVYRAGFVAGPSLVYVDSLDD